MYKNITFFLLVFAALTSRSSGDDQLRLGNLALPTSQQPGPLFSFGQNIVDKNDFLLDDLVLQLRGKSGKNLLYFFNGFLYGVSDSCVLYCALPVNRFQQNNLSTTGVGDIWIQGEYAFYEANEWTYTNQATIVGSLLLPSGSSLTLPPLGRGTVGVFLGATASHLGLDWYLFTSHGLMFNTSHQQNQGTVFYYEFGIGYNLGYRPESILLGLLEINGILGPTENVNALRDKGRGGNVIFVGPSIFFSNERLIAQLGVQAPVLQQFSDIHPKNFYRIGFTFAWKF